MNYVMKFLMMFIFSINAFSFGQLKTDKEFLQKIKNIQNNQLQKLVEFTPGFKTALKSFFEYDWQQVAKTARKKETQEEVKKVALRLQQDYKNLNLDALVTQLKQLGNIITIKQSSKETIQHFSDVLQEIKKAEYNVYNVLKTYEKKVEPILSWLLQFSALTPAPYNVWLNVYKDVQANHAMLDQFIEVLNTSIEKKDNKAVVQKYYHNANSKFDNYKKEYTSFKNTIDKLMQTLHETLVLSTIDALINKARESKSNMYQALYSLQADLIGFNIYYSYVDDIQIIKKWQELISEFQKIIKNWTSMQEKWLKQFEDMVSRHRNIYDFVSKKRRMQEINKIFESEEPLITNISSLLQEIQTNLMKQKNLLSTKP